MFSFIKKYAESMNGVDVYPKIAMFIFLVVFVDMLLIVWKADKKYIDELEHMPLNENDN